MGTHLLRLNLQRSTGISAVLLHCAIKTRFTPHIKIRMPSGYRPILTASKMSSPRSFIGGTFSTVRGLARWPRVFSCAGTGELRVMFSQDDVQGVYMDKFFAAYPDPAISWIHHLGQRRYEDAAEALLSESEAATHLNTKHVWSIYLENRNRLTTISSC
jgi:hypothetical protein